MICRTFFCLDCYKNNRPKSGDYIVLYKKSEKQLIVGYLEYNVHKLEQGFTPHLITVKERKNNLVLIEIICGVGGCGVYVDLDKEQKEVLYYQERKKLVTLSDVSYEVLLNRSDYGYKLLI